MKALFFKASLVFALLVLAQGAFAEMYIEKRKQIRKSFAANEQTEVEINSKYGTVNIMSWVKDSVAFKVEVIGKSKNEDFSQEMIEDTEVRISGDMSYIILNTEFDDEGAQLITTLNKVAGSISGSKSQIEVNITVWMPENVSVKIDQKFGDVIIGNRSGKIEVDASYCDVKIGDVTGYTDVSLKFGDLHMQTVKRLNLECEYADVVVFKLDNADVNSKGSKINLHEINRLRARTKRDNYTIYKAGSVNADGSYSDFVVTEISGSINFTGKFGDITVHNVLPSFSQITMNCEHSNANLSFDDACQFSLDLNLEMGDFSYPMGMINVTEKEEDDSERTKYFGYVGSNAKPSSKVEVFGKETDVNITLK